MRTSKSFWIRRIGSLASRDHSPDALEERLSGVARRVSDGGGAVLLFTGPDGVGKTTAAGLLGNKLNADVKHIDTSTLVSKYIGETEKNLQRVLDEASKSGTILFFEEADAVFGKRTKIKDSHDRYANQAVNYLLQRLEDASVLAILSTDRREDFDRALLRGVQLAIDFS